MIGLRSLCLILILALALFARLGAQSQPEPASPTQTTAATEPERPQQRAAEASSTLHEWGMLGATIVIAAFTVVLAVVSGRQARIAIRQTAVARRQSRISIDHLTTTKEIERAYLALSVKHVRFDYAPDGLGGQDSDKPTGLSIEIEITNLGRTPGDLLGGFFSYTVGEQPYLDVTRSGRLTPAFLFPDTPISFYLDVTEDAETLRRVLRNEPDSGFWLIADVHYEDRFGDLHTGGYGRKLIGVGSNPMVPLSFGFTPDAANWNYDRPMHPEVRKNLERD